MREHEPCSWHTVQAHHQVISSKAIPVDSRSFKMKFHTPKSIIFKTSVTLVIAMAIASCEDDSIRAIRNQPAVQTCPSHETYDSSKEGCVCDISAHWTGESGNCKCENGYKEADGICEPDEPKTCTQKGTIFSESENRCVCDAENHWTGEAGSCECETGYNEENEHCVPEGCHTGEIRDEESLLCVCDTQNHWTGTAGSCVCDADYLNIDDTCVPKITCSGTGETRDDTANTCICDTTSNWTGEAGACECASDFIQIGDHCETPVECTKTGEIKDAENNKCLCDEENHWMRAGENCACASGYVEIDQACEVPLNGCGIGEIIDTATNRCVCDINNHWISKDDTCTCEKDYVRIGDTCEELAICTGVGEILNESTNKCVCDTDNHWTGTAGSCDCETGYLKINNTCVVPVTCAGIGEIRDDTTNKCVCDTDNHWTGEAGACECASEFIRTGDHCEPAVECTKPGEIKDEVNNKCLCDEANHWIKSGEDCVCAPGFSNVGGVCRCAAPATMTVGSTMQFGNYYQSNSSTKEPLVWKVMDIDENNCRALLLSEKIIYKMQYIGDYPKREVTWQKSGVRSWLNGYDGSQNYHGIDYTSDNFINAAFNSGEKQRILTTKIVTGNNPTYGTNGGNDTNDRLFILDYYEAETYLSNPENRRLVITAYAKSTGEDDSSSSYCSKACDPMCSYCRTYKSNTWWLRTPGNTQEQAMIIQGDGKHYCTGGSCYSSLKDAGFATCNGTPGVVPAFWYDYSN